MTIPGFTETLARIRSAADPGTWKDGAIKRGLLPVYSDWECCYAIDANGQPFYSTEGTWEAPQPLSNHRHRHIVLAQTAKTYPELAHLLPQRQLGDPDCPSCGGTGVAKVGERVYPQFICECGGLGWFPANSELGAV
jgi:hypothetical protein